MEEENPYRKVRAIMQAKIILKDTDLNQIYANVIYNAKKYDIHTITHTGIGAPFMGIFEIDVMFLGRAMLIWNLAFKAGSSKHGKARRASVAWN